MPNVTTDILTPRELAAIIAERDRQYAQRFEAQQKAVEAALQAQEKATAAAFAAASEAVKTAQTANEKRFDSVNEFRSQLKDQAQTFATRNEVEVRFKAMADKFEALATQLTEMRSRNEGAAYLWTIIAAVGGLMIGGTMAALAISRRTQATTQATTPESKAG